jgi:hypothetical protein
MQIVETGFPMERIAMHILCELPVTSGGNKHILVISDYYTTWTECFAMPNMEVKCGQHRKYCSIIPLNHSI